MNVHSRWSGWILISALGLACLVGVCAAPALAGPGARTAASPLEITVVGALTRPPFFDEVVPGYASTGTFSSRAPFCPTGTFVDDLPNAAGPVGAYRQFTCDDGTGSLTVSIGTNESLPPWTGQWRVVEGSGSYAGLNGRGSARAERVGGEIDAELGGRVTWRGTFEGVADRDWIAPSIGIASARATKLRGRSRAYSISLRLSLRDNPGNPVSYTLRAVAHDVAGTELARAFGTAEAAVVPVVLRVVPLSPKARSVWLQLTASDPIGNSVSLGRLVRLRR